MVLLKLVKLLTLIKRANNLLFALLFFSLISAGNLINIDGNFEDWELISPVTTDDEGDGLGADFYQLKITFDNEFLFIYLNFYSGEFLMQNWNEFHLYIDSDNDSSTGYPQNGLGSELVWNFGSRLGYTYINGQESEIYQNDLILRIAPTVTSSEFEIAIARESSALTLNGTQPFMNGNLFISEMEDDGDFIPSEPGGISFVINDSLIMGPVPINLERFQDEDIRLVSYNTLNEGIIDNDRQVYFKRVLQMIDPDIIVLQEHQDWEYIGDIIQSWFPNEAWNSSWTYNDLVILSRFSIINDAMMNSGRTMAALLDTEDELGSNLLIFNSHLSCCDNNEDRQNQVDTFTQEWREWVNNQSGPFEIEYGIPFVHAGDFNFVGYKEQVETIRIGDIINEVQYGNDFFPDWGMSELTDASPHHSHKRMGYTWRNDASSFNPGKLDYIFYSSTSIFSRNNYILNTLSMNDLELDDYGLQREDTQNASDHLPIIFDMLTNQSMKISKNNIIPKSLILFPNYPNPFNSQTKIKFSLLTKSKISIQIIDVSGSLVKTIYLGMKSKGMHSFYWDGKDLGGFSLGSGLYFALIKGNNFSEKQKIILLK